MNDRRIREGIASSSPAGWYSDPWRLAAYRYWDGVAWTAHVSPAPRASARSRSTFWWAAGVAVVAALGLVASIAIFLRPSADPPLPAGAIQLPGPQSLGVSIAADDSVVWIADFEGHLWSIDPHTRIATTRGQVPSVSDMALGSGSLWVVGDHCAVSTESDCRSVRPVVYQLDRTNGDVKRVVDLTPDEQPPQYPGDPDLVIDADQVWVSTGVELVRLDAKSGALVSRVPLPAETHSGDWGLDEAEVATTPGSIWTTQAVAEVDATTATDLLRLDPDSGKTLSRIRIDGYGSDLLGTATGVWLCGTRLTKVSLDGTTVLEAVDLACDSLALRDGRLWVAYKGDEGLASWHPGYVVTVDLQTRAQTTHSASASPVSIDVAAGTAWVLDYWDTFVLPIESSPSSAAVPPSSPTSQ
jgi:hypothetical protein